MNDHEILILGVGIYFGAMVSMLAHVLVNLREATRQANAAAKAADRVVRRQAGDIFYGSFRIYRLHDRVTQLGRAV